jgi:G3E family GTPase
MESEGFTLDSIITVVDCINFTGYEDTSYTAKLQAQYSDVILLNKHELVKHTLVPRMPMEY